MKIELIILLLLPMSLSAATGRTGAALLQEPFGARPFAMGQAYAAVGNDLYGMIYNPATLSRLQASEAGAQLTQSFEDIRMGHLAFSTPLNPAQALGLNISYLDAGTADVFNAAGSQTRSVAAERDFLVALGYAHSWSVGPGGLHLGVSGKTLKSTVFDEAQATAYAADLGSLYAIRWGGGLGSAAAVVTNLGPKIRYSGGLARKAEADPLPLTTRLALGYMRDIFSGDSLALGLQMDRIFYDNDTIESVGVEYNYHRLVSIRLGYLIGEDLGNISMGVGLHFKNLSADYGMGLMQTFDNIQQFSLRYRFNIPGIRYPQPTVGPTAIETMVQRVRTAMEDARYFDATQELQRLNDVFGQTQEGTDLKNAVHREIERVLIRGNFSPRYTYALAFTAYQQQQWQAAVAHLETSLRKEPDNREIRKYLEKTRQNLQGFERQMKLELEARIGMLFELANSAYENKDYARAERIVNEILRLSPYRPAESLRRKISVAKTAIPPTQTETPSRSISQTPALSEAPKPSAENIAMSEKLYYDALRYYADNDILKARDYLREALRLNPDGRMIQTALQGLEKEFQKQTPMEPRP